MIHFSDVFNAKDLWLVVISIDRKTMVCDGLTAWNSAKPINCEAPICIIRLQDLSNIFYSSFVLVRVGSNKMQAVRTLIVAIASCVINSTSKSDCPPWTQIVNKRGHFYQILRLKLKHTSPCPWEIILHLKLKNSHRHSVAFVLVLTNSWYSDFSLEVGITKNWDWNSKRSAWRGHIVSSKRRA